MAHSHSDPMKPPPQEEMGELGDGVVLLPDKGKIHLFDKPKNVKRVIRIFFALCIAILLLDVLFVSHVIHKHLSFKDDKFIYENWFGFYPFYGFIACVLLVLVAKQLRKILMRPEDYYDDPR